MKKSILMVITACCLLILSSSGILSYEGSWVMNKVDRPAPGYLRFSPSGTKSFSLVDNYGKPQYEDTLFRQLKLSNYRLLKNGLWICLGIPQTKKFKYYLLNQDLQLVDSIPLSTTYNVNVHEVDVLSNGHYLVLYIKPVVMDMSQLVEDGQTNAVVNSALLVETDRTGTVYWEWNSLDYISMLDATWEVELRAPLIEFPHLNSFCEDLDGNIIVSFRHSDEIAKINRETSELMWRMGGDSCKNNQFTFINDTDEFGFTGFSHQHSISILDNGNLLMYDNGNMRTNQYSRAVEYELDQANKKATKVWEYRHSPAIFCGAMGSAYRLSNGNTLINWGFNRITEVTQDKKVVLDLEYFPTDDNDVSVYRAYKYVTKMDAVTKTISGTGNYSFINSEFNTGSVVTVSSLSGTGEATIEKHYYAPPTAEYNDSGLTGLVPRRWVLSSREITSVAGSIKIYIGDVPDLQNPEKLKLQKRDKEATGKFTIIPSSYNASTKEITADFTGMGEFILSINNLLTPSSVSYPANNATGIPISGNFEWDTLAGAQNYQLQVSKSSLFTDLIINRIVNKNTIAEYSNLDYLTKFYCRHRGYNSSDTSDWSQIISFTTDSIPEVKLISPINNYIGFDETDSLVWEKIPGNIFYRMQISGDSLFSQILTDTNSLTELYFIPSGLNYNAAYYWRVWAYDGNIEGNWQETRRFTTTLSPPVLISPADLSVDIPIKDSLFWNRVDGAESYHVEISESKNFKVKVSVGKSIKDTIFKYDSLKPYTNYFWRARALRDKDTSAWPEVFGFTTIAVAPILISPADKSANLPLNTILAWDSLSNADDYRLQLAFNSSFTELITDTSGLVSASLSATDLPADTLIYWRVSAHYKDKYSDWSNHWSFTTSPDAPLTKPVLLSPSNNSIKFVKGSMIWQPVSKATAYTVQISDNLNFVNPLFDIGNIAATNYEYKGLEYDKLYYWRIKAHGSAGNSVWSAAWVLNTQPEKVSLLSPKNDEMQVPLDAELQWEPLPDVDSYHIQIASDKEFILISKDTSMISDNSVFIVGLENNKTYYWKVKYNKHDTSGNWSEVFSFTTKSLITLPIPVILNPADGQSGVNVDGQISWGKVPGADYYKLTISKDSNFQDIIFRDAIISDTLASYPVLEYNTTYYWRIVSLSQESSSQWSAVMSFLTELQFPELKLPLDNSENIPKAGKLSWQQSNNAESYSLQVSTDSLFGTTVINETGIEQNEFDYFLAAETQYFWRVGALSKINNSRWSGIWKFSTEPANGITDLSEISSLLIYPNPASDVLQLNVSAFNNMQFIIYSIEGEEVAKGMASNGIIDISSLNPGCYYLRISEFHIKFIKVF